MKNPHATRQGDRTDSCAFPGTCILCLLLITYPCGAPPPASALVTPDEINTVRVYKKMAEVTVLISSAYVSTHHVPQGNGRGIGSGVLIDDQGSIITNAHVVDGATKLTVTLHDGTRLPAELVGSDPQSDVALLRVVLPKGKYPHARLGDSDKLEVGQTVLAIGHPYGLGYAMSSGIISGFGEVLEAKQEALEDRIIQTTAPMNPGNSGGPLVDSDDRVVGLNSSVLMGAQNIGFAIPINKVVSIVKELQLHGRVIRPWLGVKGKFVTEELRNLIALPMGSGVLIEDVDDGSPAEKIGLRAGQLNIVIEGEPWVLGGDILVAINGHDQRTRQDYAAALQTLQAHQTVELTILRDGASQSMRVTLGERPAVAPPQQRQQSASPSLVPQAFSLVQF